MIKNDLWCGYCRCQNFIELKHFKHPDDQRYSAWECTNCHAVFEDNPGYGYFTTHWGRDENRCKGEHYSLNTGESLDNAKLPRTPEGIVRHSSSREELESYLERTQVK